MNFQQTVTQTYDAVSLQLKEAITAEIQQRDKEALQLYITLISQTDVAIEEIQRQYASVRLSPVDKVTFNTLGSLKFKIQERRNNVDQRLRNKQAMLINDETQNNASSYSSFMSAFTQVPRPRPQAQVSSQQQMKPPRVPSVTKVPTTAQQGLPQRASDVRPRKSLDLPPQPRRSMDNQRTRQARPKSVDLTISRAAVLAWQDNLVSNGTGKYPQRAKSPPPQQMPPFMRKTSQRKYDYVQPQINTQIHLTQRSKSPSSTTVMKKTRVIVDAQGQQQRPTRDIQKHKPDEKKKEYSDPRIAEALENLQGVDQASCEQIIEEIMVTGERLTWDDLAGLESAKSSLKETVVYPFLRPDLFKGLREPITGMLLFGPPGTGKTMIAKTVANESQSTFFSISASSLISKYLGESEKLIRALFFMAKKLAPSIIFFDEIDSLLTARSDGEHESSRRVKTEFLIQWSALSSATSREQDVDKSRVLVLAATNLPWAIDEAARRRFSRRLYIPLPEFDTRLSQLHKLLDSQSNNMTDLDFVVIANKTDGYSNSDLTSLAKEAAMEPIRELGEINLMSIDHQQIRGLTLNDLTKAMRVIRKSVAKETLTRFDDWAERFGSTGV